LRDAVTVEAGGRGSSAMSVRDAILAVFAAVIWGFAFVAVKFGLESFSAPRLTTLRFLIASLAVLFVPRPRMPWLWIVLIGLTLFTGQFLLLFFAYTHGMPPGVASVTQQAQVFFTVLLAAVFLREVPTPNQWLGMAVAFAGLVLIGSTIGSDLTLTGFGLALSGALSWAIGNLLVKQAPRVPMFPLVAWASLIPPLPALAIAAAYDRRISTLDSVAHASWASIGAAVYLGVAATIVAYAIWGHLLQRYRAGIVAPFAFLAPCAGVVSSAVILGEAFTPARYAGMALILTGFAVIMRSTGQPALGIGRSVRS
jgi:O-acetylserine/cysteine efflux transporter